MDVTVDYERCQALGVCEALAPEVFSIDGEGVMRVDQAAAGDETESVILEAVAACPTFALHVSR